MIDGYPLHWPASQPRTKNPKRSDFGKRSLEKACQGLLAEIRRMGGKNPIISTNVRLRLDGLPYSHQSPPQDRGAAVYFKYEGEQVVYACDIYDRVECNVWGLAKTIEAFRAIARYGGSRMLKQAFAGFLALPPARSKWWEVLEVSATATEAEIKSAFRAKAADAHPDRPGGSHEMMTKINQAYADAQKERGIV